MSSPDPAAGRAYLRGALLGSGSLSGPRAPHLEIRFGVDSAERRSSLRSAAREDVELSLVDRGRHAAAYAKGSGGDRRRARAAGANDLVLVFEERAVVADTKSRANRLANADHANLVRTSRAAHEQISAVTRAQAPRAAERAAGSAVREVAVLRLAHPSLSLRELALECGTPTSKAAVHRRLRSLVELAQS